MREVSEGDFANIARKTGGTIVGFGNKLFLVDYDEGQLGAELVWTSVVP